MQRRLSFVLVGAFLAIGAEADAGDVASRPLASMLRRTFGGEVIAPAFPSRAARGAGPKECAGVKAADRNALGPGSFLIAPSVVTLDSAARIWKIRCHCTQVSGKLETERIPVNFSVGYSVEPASIRAKELQEIFNLTSAEVAIIGHMTVDISNVEQRSLDADAGKPSTCAGNSDGVLVSAVLTGLWKVQVEVRPPAPPAGVASLASKIGAALGAAPRAQDVDSEKLITLTSPRPIVFAARIDNAKH
jgi:hypothetical protein